MAQNLQTQTVDNKGADWPAVWDAARESILSCHSGASRPAYAIAGTRWYCTADKTLYYYDGANDIALFAVDDTNHLLLPPIGGGITSLPSAAAVDLGSVAQSSITISGTTTITSFGAAMKPGQVKVLTFSGTITVTNSSTLILPGAANITTAVGDVMWMLCTASGSYRCICYQPISGCMSATAVAAQITSALSSYVTTSALNTILSSYATTSAVSAAIASSSTHGRQMFISSGTFVVPSGISVINITLLGGGGGGGGGGNYLGGGGGAAGTFKMFPICVVAGSSYPVTVGAGGSSGSYNQVAGGAGGTSYFSTYGASGGAGGSGTSSAASAGGSSYYASGGAGAMSGNGTAATSNTGAGGGGGGYNSGNTGGVGGSGLVVVEW